MICYWTIDAFRPIISYISLFNVQWPLFICKSQRTNWRETQKMGFDCMKSKICIAVAEQGRGQKLAYIYRGGGGSRPPHEEWRGVRGDCLPTNAKFLKYFPANNFFKRQSASREQFVLSTSPPSVDKHFLRLNNFSSLLSLHRF